MGRVAVAKDKPKDCMEDRVILRPRKLDCGPPGAPFREPPKPPFVARSEGRIEDRPSDWLENCNEEPARESPSRTGQRTELSNVRETGWKIEGKTGQRAELINVWKTGWKIEGMTDGKPRPFSPARKPLPEDPCADGERSANLRYN